MWHQADDRRAQALISTRGERTWKRPESGEPCLDELLDDPIMTLLWRSDGLEPASARAMLEDLRMLVRNRASAAPTTATG
ncbi:hypothetical protein [Benzoatithermus flavus]|uniref:Uncharacterized protein n=1 Tax=Benzoatithermus flavus TaxID=3108223 RepID=A0ABU8XQX2_9PROT